MHGIRQSDQIHTRQTCQYSQQFTSAHAVFTAPLPFPPSHATVAGTVAIVTAMARRSILIRDDELTRDTGYVLVCSGYLVKQGRVLPVITISHRFGR